MKEVMVFVGLVLLTASSFGLPMRKGDSIIFTNTITLCRTGKVSQTYWDERGIFDYNPSTDEVRIYENSETDSYYVYKWEPGSAFDRYGYIKDIEQFCANKKKQGYPARIEMKTVPAGTFKTCWTDDGHMFAPRWFSDQVPFGFLAGTNRDMGQCHQKIAAKVTIGN